MSKEESPAIVDNKESQDPEAYIFADPFYREMEFISNLRIKMEEKIEGLQAEINLLIAKQLEVAQGKSQN